MKRIHRTYHLAAVVFLAVSLFLSACVFDGSQANHGEQNSALTYVELNENQPEFTEADYTTEVFEIYSELDVLGRCGVAYANICKELMPTEEREEIGMIKPSGWQTVKYDCVDGKYLYNRCHLIGFQLAGENANAKNLITGTRYMNVEGMLPFENMVAEYVRDTGHHVLYRITPIYEGANLVASGVQMEGWSVEDEGEGICFNVLVNNMQPGVEIDYATGDSWLSNTIESEDEGEEAKKTDSQTFILNKNTDKFHLPSCSSVEDMKAKNRKEYVGTKEELKKQGYEPCERCMP